MWMHFQSIIPRTKHSKRVIGLEMYYIRAHKYTNIFTFRAKPIIDESRATDLNFVLGVG